MPTVRQRHPAHRSVLARLSKPAGGRLAGSIAGQASAGCPPWRMSARTPNYGCSSARPASSPCPYRTAVTRAGLRVQAAHRRHAGGTTTQRIGTSGPGTLRLASPAVPGRDRRVSRVALGEAPRDHQRQRLPGLRCLTPCHPVSPPGHWDRFMARRFTTAPGTPKAFSLSGKGPDLRKPVAGAGFEPAATGL